jgi:hypothetical protein
MRVKASMKRACCASLSPFQLRPTETWAISGKLKLDITVAASVL